MTFHLYGSKGVGSTVIATVDSTNHPVTDLGSAYDLVLSSVQESALPNPVSASVNDGTTTRSGIFYLQGTVPASQAPTFGAITLTGNQLSVNWVKALTGRRFALHVSEFAQPTNDATIGTDLAFSWGIGEVEQYTATISKQGQYTAYIRLRYSDNEWEDGDTTVAEGRYIDTTFVIDIPVTTSEFNLSTSGMQPLLIPSSDYGFDGAMPTSAMNAMWGSVDMTTRFGNTTSIGAEEFEGKRCFIVRQKTTPAYQVSDRVTWAATFNNGFETEMRLIYRVRVDADGDNFASGNKLSGQTAKLGYGFASSGDASGGSGSPEVCSARFDWKRLVSNGPLMVAIYLYHANQLGDDGTGSTGDNLNTGVTIDSIAGTWAEFAMDVKANTSYGASNGVLRVWINGELRINRTDIQWMSQQRSGDPSTPHFYNAYFSSFFGGGITSNWTMQTEQYYRYAEPYIGVGQFS